MAEVSSSYLAHLVNNSVVLGAPEAQLLAVVPGGREALGDAAGRFPADLAATVLNLAAETTGIDAIGLRIGLQFRPTGFIDVGYALTAASTVGQALEINMRYQPLNQEVIRTRLEVDAGLARIVLEPALDDPERVRRVTEGIFAGYASIGRRLLWDEVWPATGMHFRHARPTEETCALYASVFGGELHFGAPENMMFIDPALLARPLPNADADLVALLTARLDARLASMRAASGLRLLVKSSLHKQIREGRPSLDETAKLLGMSGRSLRRRLLDENLTYSELLSATRREAAQVYIQEDAMTLAEIAGRLGYNDQTAFMRAFKGWFGMSPGAYRETLRERKG